VGVDVCYCVVPKYVDVVITYALLIVGSSPCLCSSSSTVYRFAYVELYVILEAGHTIQCKDFSESETPGDGCLRSKHIVRKKGDNKKLHCIRRYIV
jgi:hypothetical protein